MRLCRDGWFGQGMPVRASNPLGYNEHYSFSARMLRRLLVFFLLFLVVPWLPAGLFASITMAQTSVPVAPVPPIAARSWLLLDYRTGHVIASHGADERVEPASLTKLMTAYLVFGALKQDLLAPS